MRTRRDADLNPDRPRVFGIGLNKTGTMTLDRALTILGFESLHHRYKTGTMTLDRARTILGFESPHPRGQKVHDAVQRAIDDGAPLLSHLDARYDAFSDIGLLSRRFRILDAQYPGSKFILTVRPVEAWLDSRRRHVERNIALKEAGEYGGTFLVVDEKKWTTEWEHHTSRVRDYFKDRSDFLEVDLTLHADWSTLCAFLAVPVPKVEFPWVNRDKAVDHTETVNE